MPKREKKPPKKTGRALGYIAGAGEIVEQDVGDTLRKNYMPYAMSVILSRALPEIDGLKPSQRKLLYTMYKMGLLTGARTKSANIVGQTMKLNPHGDAAIYDTMVRLSRGYEALLHPYVDSKGPFTINNICINGTKTITAKNILVTIKPILSFDLPHSFLPFFVLNKISCIPHSFSYENILAKAITINIGMHFK